MNGFCWLVEIWGQGQGHIAPCLVLADSLTSLTLLHSCIFPHTSSILDCSENSEFLSLYFTEHLHYSLQKSPKYVSVRPAENSTDRICPLESGDTYRLMRCYFVFLSKIYCLAIKPLVPGCSPQLEASGVNTASLQPEEECCHLKKEKLALFERQREASGADASLFGGKMVVVLKLPKLGLVPCVFRAQSHDYLNFFFFFFGWFSILLLGCFPLIASVLRFSSTDTNCTYYVPSL